MNQARAFKASRAVGRIKRIWSELDYAERRLFEIRTGVPATRPDKREQGHA